MTIARTMVVAHLGHDTAAAIASMPIDGITEAAPIGLLPIRAAQTLTTPQNYEALLLSCRKIQKGLSDFPQFSGGRYAPIYQRIRRRGI